MPLDRGIVDQQLRELGEGSRWWDVRELRDLPAVLHDDERLLTIARGKIGRGRGLRRAWLIVTTDQRLLCLRSGKGTSWRQEEVPAEQITRVTLRIGPFRGRVLVVGGGRRHRLLLKRSDAHRLQSALALLNTAANRHQVGFAPGRVVRRVVDHMLALPAVALDPAAIPLLPPAMMDTSRLEARIESLETQLGTLQEQVEFLEGLLRERHAEAGPAGPR